MNITDTEISRGNILIVDDTPENLHLLFRTLSEQGYEVRGVVSGAMALRVVQLAPPDLLLLDVKMPEMNGYQVCQSLKANDLSAGIPVIFISAMDETIDKVKAFAVGGADYITKPFQVEEVLARVEHQITITRLQKQLEAQNRELVRSNQELEQFAHIVSHDLQQPLQDVIMSAELLAAKYQSDLDEKAHGYLQHIQNGTMRMGRLIHDVLAYSKAGSETQQLQAVDCEVLLEEVLANLKLKIAQAKASVITDKLPTLMANETQLFQLFQNLITNALKFRCDQRVPQIKISVQQTTQGKMMGENPSPVSVDDVVWLIGVHDNGIGIEPKQSRRVFEIFQRLNPEYPGTGIGLATCKKIVEYHGGRIWLESEPGLGTTFYFTMPMMV